MTASNPAETYESYMVPTLFAPWASCLVQTARVLPGERVLDVGCGTGVVARGVAPIVGSSGKVVGLDLNPQMLAVARAAGVREGLAIEWQEGRAEKIPYPNGQFDLVLCQFALMFFAERRAALGEMYRVLTDGGRLVLSVWQGLDLHLFYRALHDAIERRLGISGVQEIFALGDAVELRALLADAGFREIEIEPVSMTAHFPHPAAFLAGEIAVDTAAIPSMQHLDEQERRQITEAIHEDMAGPLRGATASDHVVIPFHALIARATR